MLNFFFETLILILLILAIYLIGYTYIHFYLTQFKNRIKDDFYKLFAFSVSFGFILSTSIISVVYTGFETLFIYPFLFFIYPILKRDSILIVNDSFKSSLLGINIRQAFTLFTCFLLLVIYNSIVYWRSGCYFFLRFSVLR